MDKDKLIEDYGKYSFNKKKMKEVLPETVYEEYISCLESGEELSNNSLKVIAEEMKKWALSLGATHYTHWFSSLNGMTAEKHEAFLEPKGNGVYYKFDSEMLLKGESDASSFPNGGLRSTYKARGYTLWDKKSICFIKDKTLYIPSLFYSSSGESLDYKTHLIKSCETLNNNAKTLLKLLGINVNRVDSYVGAEQEYFLILKEHYNRRVDLQMTGRTLIGSLKIKEQEDMEHYFAPTKEKVRDFVRKLDLELWKYGIPSKVEHNEAAPNQFEVVSVYRKVNTASDHNMLLMVLMKEIAENEGLVCLMHEKPFFGINGSGKHNNWSLISDTNNNLFIPGKDPINNLPFLCLLSCLIKGIDEYGELLGLSISSYDNELRLGDKEAPPRIISICLGEGLNKLIEKIKTSKEEKNNFEFSKDDIDRNRTSLFAFVGNRFEFRGVGSSQSIAFVNTILNSILSYEIKLMIKEIRKGNKPMEIVKKYLTNHSKVIFEGDGYSSYWKKEAKRRGLKEFSFIDSINCLRQREIIKVLLEQNIFTQNEINSLYKILLDKYCRKIAVEARTLIHLIDKEIYGASIEFLHKQIQAIKQLKSIKLTNEALFKKVKELNSNIEKLMMRLKEIKISLKEINSNRTNDFEKAKKYQFEIISKMDKLREIVDNIEDSIDKNNWPLPSYMDLLFSL